jgi:hypothetical protein
MASCTRPRSLAVLSCFSIAYLVYLYRHLHESIITAYHPVSPWEPLKVFLWAIIFESTHYVLSIMVRFWKKQVCDDDELDYRLHHLLLVFLAATLPAFVIYFHIYTFCFIVPFAFLADAILYGNTKSKDDSYSSTTLTTRAS